MPLKARVNYPRLDLKKCSENVHKTMVDKVTHAAKVWVQATTDNVPVLTGASKASFLKLAFEAKIALSITPRTVSRIPLGIDTSTGVLHATKGKTYGFEWSSNLEYIHVVDRHNRFLTAGDRALRKLRIRLPKPVIKRSKSS